MALARMLTKCGHEVLVWSAISEEIETLKRTRRQKSLPDMLIPASTEFTTDIGAVCKNKRILLFAVPSVFVRTTIQLAAPCIPEGQIIVDVAKGIEPDTL